MTDLNGRIEELARSPVLLIASDYDGTLSPIVSDPAKAVPVRESIVALRSLAAMPQTHVAVISGRALRDLAALTGAPEEIRLVGSHGSEFDPNFAQTLSAETLSLHERLAEDLSQIAARGNGFSIEQKPASIAFHYRNADEQQADELLKEVMKGPGSYEGVFTKTGKKVVELGVVCTNKGSAMDLIRHRVGASAALFVGDDETDEDAFATLKGPDLGVKVGPGESLAAVRVADTQEVAQLLARLAELRHEWLAGSEAVPIEKHSLLSDQRTIALVTPGARMSWLCVPRIDSQAIFAELLGGPAAGFFAVRPEGDETEPEQAYEDGSFVLKTRWPDLTVTDYMDCSDGRSIQRAGRVDIVRVLEGHGKAVIEFAPRLDFGRTPTRLHTRGDGLELEGSLDPVVLRAPGVEWTFVEEGPHQTAIGTIDLSASPVVIELRFGTGNLKELILPEPQRREQTERNWNRWAGRLTVPEQHAEVVRRSALVLRALCHMPTGAIAAAGTTSLPETLGGVRNWDYRFCWPRDASLAAASLSKLGSNTEAMRFLDWMLGVVDRCESADRMAPIYTVDGADLTFEGEISELAGYAGSRPVRVGNAAARQVQLDVFGPIVDLIAVLLERGAPLSSEHWRLVEAMAGAVEHRWREPDHGIWELRQAPHHHVHSKAMCCVTMDRAATISEHLLGRTRDDYIALRDEIRDEILEKGWNDRIGSFTATYGGEDIDAAVLLLGLTGVVDPHDERFVKTVEAVEASLRNGPTVYRYRYDDGLPGIEGGFNLCTCWLIESYAAIGRIDDARALFEQYLGLVGPTGMLAEEYGPRTGRALGNVPQAYSHLGLINAALRLSNGS